MFWQNYHITLVANKKRLKLVFILHKRIPVGKFGMARVHKYWGEKSHFAIN